MSNKYGFICSEEGHYPIVSMCRWAKVSASGYYDWRSRPASATELWRDALGVLIEWLFNDSDATYGYRRIHASLARLRRPCDPHTVRSIMRDRGLVAAQPRRQGPKTTISSDAGTLPDLVKRDFTATVPGTKLVGDITYIDTWQGWVYLATVLDCATKKVVGYAMADHMRTSLVIDALAMAVKNGHTTPEATIFHSDRGTQYTSAEFATYTGQVQIIRSVGRTGICYDNAWAESFNATLKKERVYRTSYPTRRHAIKDIARWIELRYNQKRLHSALGYRTPNEAEQDWHQTQSAA